MKLDAGIHLCHLQRADEERLAHEGNRRDGHAGLPASAGLGRHTGAGQKKPRQRFIDEVWPGVKPG